MMDEPLNISVSIPKTLLDAADALAHDLNMSRNQLFEMAVERFVSDYPKQKEQNDVKAQTIEPPVVINQGDIYWVQLDDASGLEAGIPHPHVVIQDNVINHSRIHTVVACALTSNIKRASLPGNVLLDIDEAHLSRQSVVEVSKVSTVDKSRLGEYIGTLNEQRISQILAGMRFLQASFFTR